MKLSTEKVRALTAVDLSLCKTCGRKLDNPSDRHSMDCGGDCLKCMADAGDPTCIAAIEQIKKERNHANADLPTRR